MVQAKDQLQLHRVLHLHSNCVFLWHCARWQATFVSVHAFYRGVKPCPRGVVFQRCLSTGRSASGVSGAGDNPMIQVPRRNSSSNALIYDMGGVTSFLTLEEREKRGKDLERSLFSSTWAMIDIDLNGTRNSMGPAEKSVVQK